MKNFLLLLVALWSVTGYTKPFEEFDIWADDKRYYRSSIVREGDALYVAKTSWKNISKRPSEHETVWALVDFDSVTSWKRFNKYRLGDVVTFKNSMYIKSKGWHNPALVKPTPYFWQLYTGMTEDDGLPPEPPEDADQGLLGVDSNGNGVRDDVERFVATENKDLPKVVPFLNKLVSIKRDAYIEYIYTGSVPDSFLDDYIKMRGCVKQIAPLDHNKRLSSTHTKVVNTPERYSQTLRVDKAMAGGKSIVMITPSVEECNSLIK
ncbi:hypothetical protein DS2_10692 [Catenovulum agarivorans DS-2]|uniref:Uncharacterized protein n=1 Tax=Catenovulum agarivorans DS-2 TaxID=1328313 RepID=W7QPU5_9ALTE|nr:hypothetical protein [Catenovulum agarivorans]EWH09908.1 hypothetical protein DS2_10692 [Catenovulum agarivorans DS-2]